MAATSRMKASDKQDLCKKLLALLRSRYHQTFKQDLPVLETMLYAAVLENASAEQADSAYGRLFNEFLDLNEVRVSSVYELERLFQDMPDTSWKPTHAAGSGPQRRAMHVKMILQYIFEKAYQFDYESLRRKTQEIAAKELGKIKGISPFVRSFTQQQALDSHLLAIDDAQNRVLIWLGLSEPGSSTEQTAELVKPLIRKSDGQLFCHLIRCLATDPKIGDVFTSPPAADDAANGLVRLEAVISDGGKKARRAAATAAAKVEHKKEELKKEEVRKEDLKKSELKKTDVKKEDVKKEDTKKDDGKKDHAKKDGSKVEVKADVKAVRSNGKAEAKPEGKSATAAASVAKDAVARKKPAPPRGPGQSAAAPKKK